MKRPIQALATATALCAALASPIAPALADPTDPAISSEFYANARNWLIESLHNAMAFTGCRATIPLQSAGPLLIERRLDLPEGWAIYVPTSQGPSPVFGSAVAGRLIIDATETPGEYQIHRGGWASTALSADMREQLMAGNYITTAIDGDDERQWILNGSTAALETLEECYAQDGIAWR
ncbi:hypothetical protein JI664_11890 [Rhodobacter sp. NTK016B]|uniref:hypothetical protein n=1 Tax=Rhodobacter sp. NTK016B TaxID=2759676 RepID=UPI001A8EAE12|nr:hypothetical protein [Rhodobacter sp. NTK016B]MBN8292666.1 hypothetical protein [Rhodobacter sp. NTK016B]